jgi:formylglycine-generating enzyme required for sulfatase activity
VKYLLPILLVYSACVLSQADDPKLVPPKVDGAGAAAPSSVPGFVKVPTGALQPGCSPADYKARANNDVTKGLFAFEVWGKHPPVTIPAFNIGKFEVSNAQWKLYLDRNFRVKVVCTGQDTLQALADKHIQYQGNPIEGQWKSIYALNWKQISSALKAAKNKAGVALWPPAWILVRPPSAIRAISLPKGLELEFYSCVVPSHWYGWTKLAGLSTGKDYVDPRGAPADAFMVPSGDHVDAEMFAAFKLRSNDFKNFPMRDLAPLEALWFAEWAGCTLPTEYEFERAVRAGRPNARQHPGAGPWNHAKQPGWFAFADNKSCNYGPLAVDDPSVSKGDTEFGARHMLGNVWELTRTLWDLHPYRNPKPNPESSRGLFNYAVMAKGGAWGSGYRQIQISTRTGIVGNADLDLKEINRADSLGMRLVRHDQPCYDLLTHTMRHLAFDPRLGMWSHVPHEYALPRLTGIDATHFTAATAADGYTFVQDKALGIGVLPVWATKFNKSAPGVGHKDLRNPKFPANKISYLGMIRIDLPFKAGRPLTAKEWTKLQADRKDYVKLKRLADAEASKKKKGKKKKKGEKEVAPIVLPPMPPEPDAYEKATFKNKTVWREGDFPPGEYQLVYWYGYIGLATRSMSMPPKAIFFIDKPKYLRKIEGAKGSTTVDAEKNIVELSFVIEEQHAKQKTPPKAGDSDLWALCEVLPEGWPDRVNPKKLALLKGWRFNVAITTADGALKRHKWNVESK